MVRRRLTDTGRTPPGTELVAVPWGQVGAAAGLGTLLAVLDLTVWPGDPGAALGWLAAALLGGAAAIALDGVRGDVTDAVPRGLRRRTWARLQVTLAAVVAWAAYALAVTVPDRHAASTTTTTVSGVALVLAGAAAACVMTRVGSREPGGVVTAALVVGVVALALVPLPFGLTAFDATGPWTESTRLWATVAVAAVVALLWGTADPGGRGYINPTRLRLRPGKTVADETPKRASTTSASTLR